eukprot:scaffold4510_cov183-Amphora_coffeaeformis.AAC.3
MVAVDLNTKKRWPSFRNARKTATMTTTTLPTAARENDFPLDANGGGETTSPCHLFLPSNNNNKLNCRITDDLVCPITLELPFQPVMAEDGRIYERSAIQMHFETCRKQRKQVKSPVTGQYMGKRLFPSPQTKNLIQALIDHGLVAGPLLETWSKNVSDYVDVAHWIKRARDGDAHAMAFLARGHCKGMGGLRKDLKVAYQWCKKSHDAGSCYGTFRMGYHLVYGYGVEKRVTEGMMYVLMAAERGSNAAAYWLGMWFANGKYGLSQNPESAVHWLQISLSPTCTVKTLTSDGKERAREKLRELLHETMIRHRRCLA